MGAAGGGGWGLIIEYLEEIEDTRLVGDGHRC